jgi:hypothetical protein
MALRIVFFQYLSLVLPLGLAHAEDLKLTNGTVFREVKVVEVRPDALIFKHKGGMAMADLEKLPPATRTRYGYDARRASDYRERETAKRQAEATEAVRLVAADEERKMAQARARFESAAGASGGRDGDLGELSFSPGVGAADRISAATAASVGAQIERVTAAREEAARAELTFWGSPMWKHPIVQILGGLLGAGKSGDRESTEPRSWR